MEGEGKAKGFGNNGIEPLVPKPLLFQPPVCET